MSVPCTLLDDREWVEIGPYAPLEDFQSMSWSELPTEGWVGDALAEVSPSDCSDAALLDAAVVWERLSAWVAGNQARFLAEFARRRVPGADPDGRSVVDGAQADPDGHSVLEDAADVGLDPDDSAADEVSLALRIASPTAAHRLDFARNLAGRLPRTLRAMCEGNVSVSKARTLAEQSDGLTAAQAGELERSVLRWSAGKTPGQFRRLVRREIMRIDADALHRRVAAAAEGRAVELKPLPDGMAQLSCELPGPDAVAAYNWLDQQARIAKSTGDVRTMNQLRADAFVDLVTQRSTAVARKPLIQVLVPLSTLAGGSGAADLAGYGPIDAPLARQLAADGTWQRLLTDPATGAVREVDPRRYIPPAALRTFVQARDRTCRFPTCSQPAHRCEIDHTVRYGDKSQVNPTRPDNLGALCRRHHRLKDQPGTGWSLRQRDGEFVWTTPEGLIYRVPPDPPLGPEPPPRATNKRRCRARKPPGAYGTARDAEPQDSGSEPGEGPPF